MKIKYKNTNSISNKKLIPLRIKFLIFSIILIVFLFVVILFSPPQIYNGYYYYHNEVYYHLANNWYIYKDNSWIQYDFPNFDEEFIKNSPDYHYIWYKELIESPNFPQDLNIIDFSTTHFYKKYQTQLEYEAYKDKNNYRGESSNKK